MTGKSELGTPEERIELSAILLLFAPCFFCVAIDPWQW